MAAPGLVVHEFRPGHEFSLQNNILSGLLLSTWATILRERWRDIEWRHYWLRVAFLTLMALFNSCMSVVEWLVYGRAVAAAEINRRPVFVLGHPRTGTTHLFNLLTRDTRHFTFPSTFHCGFPGTFLLLEPCKRLLSGMITNTRPMDNMSLSFDHPMEDELALNVLSGGRSPYMPLIFMTHFREYLQCVTFEGAPRAWKDAWVGALLLFLRKLTVCRGSERRPVLKSPVHTGRVRLLKQLFPEAQFVFIHRHPYDVYRSSCNLADKTYWYSYLNRPTNKQITSFVVEQYELLVGAYLEDRKLLTAAEHVEVRFADLEANPVETIRSIYAHFGWPGWDEMEADLNSYCSTGNVRGYKKNSFQQLDEPSRRMIAERWASSFREFGYDT